MRLSAALHFLNHYLRPSFFNCLVGVAKRKCRLLRIKDDAAAMILIRGRLKGDTYSD